MLDIVALGGLADRYPAQMSGGQQQRVALARALVIEPSILVLDEPFGSLDRKLREAMQSELYQLTRQLGTTSIFVTHDQQEALMLSDRVAVMNQGHVEQIGTPGEVFCVPATRFVADFMGATNFLEGRVAGSTDGLRIEAAGIAFPAPTRLSVRIGDVVNFAVRPEQIALNPDGKAPEGAIRGRVRQANYHGDTSSYFVELEGGKTLVVRQRNEDATGDKLHFPVGSTVWTSWRTDAVLTFDR